jgi:TolA-binding protein
MTSQTEVDRILEEARSGGDWIGANVEVDEAFLDRAVQATLDQIGPIGDGGGGPSSPPPPSRTIFANPWMGWIAGGCLVAATVLAIYVARKPSSEPSEAQTVVVDGPSPVTLADPVTVAKETPNATMGAAPLTDLQPVLDAPSEPVEPEPLGATSKTDGTAKGGECPKTARGPSAGELFQQANAARTDKQFDDARELYGRIVRVYPRAREAAMARISLGRLELEHFDRPKIALEHFEAYLDGSGSKPLAGEALVGCARALQELGDAKGETAAWQELLSEHPDSAHAERAQRRLAELSGG